MFYKEPWKRTSSSNRRVRPFTLVEVLVSFVLVSLLMSLLFGGYRQILYLRSELQQKREEATHELYLQNRLSWLFSRIPFKAPSKRYFFHSTSYDRGGRQQLVFTYDNGVDVLPHFAGMVLGKLYVDEQQRLCLATWPLPQGEEADFRMKHEILWQKVNRITWGFYVPPKKEKPVDTGTPISKGAKEVEPPEKDLFLDSWAENYEGLPPLVKLVMESEGKTLELAFTLPYSKYLIQY